MPILVSCWRCKQPVLMVAGRSESDLAWLCDHLAACAPEDPCIGLGVGAIRRHFRLVEIEEELEADRAAGSGEQPV